MLEDLARRVGAGLVAVVMIAVAAGIALVAASFAMYAGFRAFASPAAASALTAAVYAVIMALIALLAPKLIKGSEKSRGHREAPGADTLRLIGIYGLPMLGVLADLALGARSKGRDKHRGANHSH